MSIRFIAEREAKGHAAFEVEVLIFGKRVRRYEKTKALAKDRERELLSQRMVVNECRIDFAVTEYFENVAKDNVGHKNEKLIFNRAILFFMEECGLENVNEVKYKHLEKLIAHLKTEEGLGPASINRHFSCYKPFFKWCVNREYLEKNPCEHMRLQAVDDYNRPVASDQEYQTFLGACPAWYRPAAEFMYLTALRGKSICALQWEDVKFDEGFFTYKVRKGYGKKTEIRFFPLTEAIRALLENQAAYLKQHGILPVGKCSLFFNSELGSLTAERFSRVGNAALKDSGLAHVELYSLRHHLAQDLLKNGVELEKIRQLLGHAGVRMTRHYAGQMDAKTLSGTVEAARPVLSQSENAAKVPHRREGRNLL